MRRGAAALSERARQRLALGAAALAGIQVGAAIVGSRAVLDELGPVPLAAIRYAVAALVLAPAFVLGPPARFRAADLAAIALLGTLQFGALIALLNIGLLTVPSGPAALLFSVFPLLTLLVAALLGQERPTVAKAAGVLATIGGVGVTLGVAPAGSVPPGGAAAILGAAGIGAVCAVLFRPYLARYPTLKVSALAMLASAASLLAAAVLEGSGAKLAALGPRTGLVAFAIGLSSGVGFLLWLWALKTTTPTRATAFLALSPVTSALLGAALLGEPLPPATLAGIAAVAAGLWLASRPDPLTASSRSPGSGS